VAIAVLIVAAAWMFAMHQARTGGSPNLPLKWLGFAGMTAIVFGNAIRACRRLWGKQRFWLFLGLFFAVHSGLGVLVLLGAGRPILSRLLRKGGHDAAGSIVSHPCKERVQSHDILYKLSRGT
jgi:hypothetical protein